MGSITNTCVGRREPIGRISGRHNSRKRRRCHRRTVSAVTITRGCLHPAQTLASPTQKRRSVVRSLGRAVVLLYTASCCRRARFSTASWRWPPKRNGRSRSTWSKRGDHRAEILSGSAPTDQRLAAGRGFGEGQLAGRSSPALTPRGPTWTPCARSLSCATSSRLNDERDQHVI